MTKQQALDFIAEASRILTEIDDRAAMVASERRNGKFGEHQIEFRIRLLVEKANILGAGVGTIECEQQFANGYLFAPLPNETRK